ncbi:hypothetical protein ACHAXS_011635 [Conticribra weissflogii]
MLLSIDKMVLKRVKLQVIHKFDNPYLGQRRAIKLESSGVYTNGRVSHLCNRHSDRVLLISAHKSFTLEQHHLAAAQRS